MFLPIRPWHFSCFFLKTHELLEMAGCNVERLSGDWMYDIMAAFHAYILASNLWPLSVAKCLLEDKLLTQFSRCSFMRLPPLIFSQSWTPAGLSRPLCPQSPQSPWSFPEPPGHFNGSPAPKSWLTLAVAPEHLHRPAENWNRLALLRYY